MIKYHAILSFYGDEFSVEFESDSLESALEYLDSNYEESSVVEIGDSQYWREKQIARYSRLESELY